MKFRSTLIGKFFRYLVVSFKRLFLLRDSTNEIALGFAIGVFVGILPTFGFGALILGFLALFIRFNLIAAITGTLINNPLLVPFWLTSSYKVGEIITKMGVDLNENKLIENIFNFGLSYIVGNVVLSIIFGIISYFVVFLVLEAYRAAKKSKT